MKANTPRYVILDCYTDEPAGLGVPPYLGTYPRYIAGMLDETPAYITIDDLRLVYKYQGKLPEKRQKTDTTVYNLSRNHAQANRIISSCSLMIVIVGVHTPGKYLSAVPGTIHELRRLLEPYRCRKILTGPAIYGTQLHGGKFAEKMDKRQFDEVRDFPYTYKELDRIACKGAELIDQIPDERMIELETGRGCPRKTGCSFCLEPMKGQPDLRETQSIVNEIKALNKKGARHFRLGKQSCIYSYPELVSLLRQIRQECNISTLHIDNANPAMILKHPEKTEAIVKYCTEGNVAALGIESFDPEVIRANNLNSDLATSMAAIKQINEKGAERGPNGMPKFLPGINILLGLEKETRLTFERNLESLRQILERGMLIRRINIRKVIPFQGTLLFERSKNKYLKKNNKHYYSFRRSVRQDFDNPMLRKIVPTGTILKDVKTEIHDGNTTFGRQQGTYPLIVGIKERLALKEHLEVRVKDYMLRSIVAERCT